MWLIYQKNLFKSIPEQLEILRRRNVKITDRSATVLILQKYGYYQIVNGYSEQFEVADNSKLTEKTYQTGTTFEDIYIQFLIDRFFSQMIISDIFNVEQKLKTVIGYVIAKNFGVKHQLTNDKNRDSCALISQGHSAVLYPTSYLDKRYYDISNHSYRNVSIMFDEIEKTNKNPLKEYRENRSHIPPWILFGQTDFGKLNRYFQVLKVETKLEIVNQFMSTTKIDLSKESLIFKKFYSYLELTREFRNAFAHSFRFVASEFPNLSLTKKIRNETHTSELFINSEYKSGVGKGDLFSLLVILTIFSDDRLSAKSRVEYYENSFNQYFKGLGQAYMDITKAKQAFDLSSGLPTNYAFRLKRLADNIF